jgi:hypothetical protein
MCGLYCEYCNSEIDPATALTFEIADVVRGAVTTEDISVCDKACKVGYELTQVINELKDDLRKLERRI